jgi:hypothetical protein
MTDKPQKPVAKLTTEQTMKRLFPKPVIEHVKREIDHPQQPPKPSIPKD